MDGSLMLWGAGLMVCGILLLFCRPEHAPAGADPKEEREQRKKAEDWERLRRLTAWGLILTGAVLISLGCRF